MNLQVEEKVKTTEEEQDFTIETNRMSEFYSQLKRDPRILFGGFPSGNQVEYLQSIGVRYFIDLTTPFEKKRLPVYSLKNKHHIYVNFPIRDNFIPYDMNLFNEFLTWLTFTINVMKEDELIYIHCKGGHGRSGMLVCCILCVLFNLTPEQSISEATISHNERPLLTEKWRLLPCPPHEIQRIFIHRVFQCHLQLQQQTSNTHLQLENLFNSTRKRILHHHQKTKKLLI